MICFKQRETLRILWCCCTSSGYYCALWRWGNYVRHGCMEEGGGWTTGGCRGVDYWEFGGGGGGLASNTSYLKSPGSSNFPFSLFPWLLRSLVCQLPLNLHYSRFSGYPGSSSAPSSLVPLVPVVLYFTSFFWFFILLYSLSGSSGSCTVSFSRCHGISWCSVWSHGVSWCLMVSYGVSNGSWGGV